MCWLKGVVGFLLTLPIIFDGVMSLKPPKPNIVMIMADDLVNCVKIEQLIKQLIPSKSFRVSMTLDFMDVIKYLHQISMP